MSDFIPNAKAVVQAAEQLLAPTAGGGRPTIDDACLTASDIMHHESSVNTRVFWKAVYEHLDAKRQRPKLAQAVKDLMEAST